MGPLANLSPGSATWPDITQYNFRFLTCTPPPALIQFVFHFDAVFRDNEPKNSLAPPPLGLTPPVSEEILDPHLSSDEKLSSHSLG